MRDDGLRLCDPEADELLLAEGDLVPVELELRERLGLQDGGVRVRLGVALALQLGVSGQVREGDPDPGETVRLAVALSERDRVGEKDAVALPPLRLHVDGD